MGTAVGLIAEIIQTDERGIKTGNALKVRLKLYREKESQSMFQVGNSLSKHQ